jgi:L-alanine-DL-glutamate epimerase-like enolase superfamily enzyme
MVVAGVRSSADVSIAKLELRQITAKLPSVFSGGTYKLSERTALLCRVTTAANVVGQACVGNESSYSDYLKGLIRGPFRQILLGADPLRPEKLWREMIAHDRAYIDRPAVMMAIATVDAALWDLRGKLLDVPLWKLLGGHDPRVPIIGIGGYYETSRDAAGIEREIGFYRKRGLAGIKFKVGALSLKEDCERVRVAREAAGPDFAIVVDSNMAWTTEDAVRFAQMIAPFSPAWLEEPVHPRNVVRGLRDVRLKTGVPTGAGQSEHSVFDALRLIEAGAVDVLNVTYNRGGGITGWMKLAATAAFSDIRMGQVGEPHISMHLMAGIPNRTFVECYPDEDRDPLWAELYENRPEPIDGILTVPDRPGIGLDFDETAVERYAIEDWH